MRGEVRGRGAHRYGGGQAAGQSEGQHPAAHAERYLKNGPQGEMCSALPPHGSQAGIEAFLNIDEFGTGTIIPRP